MILNSITHCEYCKFMSIVSLNNAALFDWQLLNNIQPNLWPERANYKIIQIIKMYFEIKKTLNSYLK